jgi:glutamine synthetase
MTMTTTLPPSIRSLVTSEHVTELQLWYTDELGELEVATLSRSGIASLLEHGVALNDASHGGYGVSSGADIVAVPDWRTFRLLQPSDHGPSAAAVFCCLESTGFVGLDDFSLQ